MFTICFANHTEDGPEVQIIRREHINAFADWQEQFAVNVGYAAKNEAIGSPQSDDPACAEVVTP